MNIFRLIFATFYCSVHDNRVEKMFQVTGTKLFFIIYYLITIYVSSLYYGS